MDKYGKNQNNNANQRNPNNDAYWKSRNTEKPSDWNSKASGSSMTKEQQDNRSRQLNPNNQAYYDSRGKK